MKKLLDYGFRLFVVCAIAILGIAGLYVTAESDIRANEAKDLADALAEVLGTGEGVAETAEGSGVYRVEVDGAPIYAAEGGAQGYSSVVQVVLSARVEEGRLEVVRMRVKSQQETPGLGTVIAAQESDETFWSWIGGLFSGGSEAKGPPRYGFLDRFEGKTAEGLRVTFDAGEAERGEGVLGISGATISSDASVRAAREALTRIRAEVDAGR